MKLTIIAETGLITIPLSNLYMSRDGLTMAYYDNEGTDAGRATGPVRVARWQRDGRTIRGFYQLADGYHRVVKILAAGGDSVQATLTSMSDCSPIRDIFQYDAAAPHRGLEALVDFEEDWQ